MTEKMSPDGPRRSILPSQSAAVLSLPKPNTNIINPPKQRQRWGEEQEHPHVNWGDLFFDLFYVAMAYNLANLLKDSEFDDGLLYFFGTYGPVYIFWFNKMVFDSRYAVDDDPVHRTFEVTQLCFLAAAVLHIRPASMMSNPYDNIEMFFFSFAMSLGSIGNIVRYLELAIWAVGEPAVKISAQREILESIASTLCFVSAAIVSGISFFGSGEEYSDYGNKGRTTNIPIYFCLAGWVLHMALLVVRVVFLLPQGDERKKRAVPMNTEFVMHRYGEWTMLMLGESVLSLLTVDVSEGVDYYITFYAGILSVTMLQYLHFRSQPHHAEDYALARSLKAGIAFAMIMQVYSAALIILGASYKMILYEYIYESGYGENRLLSTVHSFSQETRLLEVYGEKDDGEKLKVIANRFCGSMAVVFVCLDLMSLCHKGLWVSVERCRNRESGGILISGALLTVLRCGLVVFIASVSLYITNPEAIALIGLACVVGQVLVRLLGSKTFPDITNKDMSHHEESIGEQAESKTRSASALEQAIKPQDPDSSDPELAFAADDAGIGVINLENRNGTIYIINELAW